MAQSMEANRMQKMIRRMMSEVEQEISELEARLSRSVSLLTIDETHDSQVTVRNASQNYVGGAQQMGSSVRNRSLPSSDFRSLRQNRCDSRNGNLSNVNVDFCVNANHNENGDANCANDHVNYTNANGDANCTNARCNGAQNSNVSQNSNVKGVCGSQGLSVHSVANDSLVNGMSHVQNVACVNGNAGVNFNANSCVHGEDYVNVQSHGNVHVHDCDELSGPTDVQNSVGPPMKCSSPLQSQLQNESAQTQLLASALETLANKLSQRDQLPKLLPETFEGDMLKYPMWMKSFNSVIEANANTHDQRLFYLGKCTAGEARRAIEGYLCSNDSNAYKRAREVLHRRYGDKYLMSRSCKTKLKNWDTVKYGDGKALRELADFLTQIRAAMESTSHLSSLDSEEGMAVVLEKLPKYVNDRWSRIVDKWLNEEEEEDQRYPPFRVFCDFLEKEARISCNIVTVNRNASASKDPKGNPQKKSARSFSTNAQRKETSVSNETPAQKSTPKAAQGQSKEQPKPAQPKACTSCGQAHGLEQCPKFSALALAERKEFLKGKGLCFGCLDGRHLSRDCSHRKRCDVCKGRHPTLLHDYNFVKSSTTLYTQGPSCTPQGKFSSMVLPVYVWHTDSPATRIMTYALLDDQSNSSFISKDTVEKLAVQGEPVKINLITMHGQQEVDTDIVHGLRICSALQPNEEFLSLPGAYSTDVIPGNKDLVPSPEVAKRWPHLRHIANTYIMEPNSLHIDLLIGLDCPKALQPKDIVTGSPGDPWAVRTALGWGIIGMMSADSGNASAQAFGTHVKEISPLKVHSMFDRDFNDEVSEEKLSLNDKKFVKIVSSGIKQGQDSHFEIPLPLKEGTLLPNNREVAVKRLEGLKRRLQNDKFRADYVDFMEDMISRGHAELAPPEDTIGRTWYLPHHGVYHPKKGKFRVVFDCSAEFEGESLNRRLLQGPNLTNDIVNILCRFRREPIAIGCDIEGMFHQVQVRPEDRNFLKFLWWKSGDLNSEPLEYRMTVHLFGATSSPGCANFALKETADRYEQECGTAAAEFVRKDFYVDDGLTSVETLTEARNLVKSSRELCKKGGFNLRKFTSNETEALSKLPEDCRALDASSVEVTQSHTERTLGVEWNLGQDTLHFKVDIGDKPLTRRGILSTVSSVYDPLGLVAPFLLTGKRILQDLVRDGQGWDDPVPDEICRRWSEFRKQLLELSEISIPRCYKDSSTIAHTELHTFSDASMQGYGQCTYIRQQDKNGKIHTALVMAKARVPPTKPVTIPRLELTAAVTAANIGKLLQRELCIPIQYFWSDSKVVLGYIANEAKRFNIFVANRVQKIHEKSNPEQWNYVKSKDNPADLASRGLSAAELRDSALWWRGPAFLRESWELPIEPVEASLSSDDPEVKKVVVKATTCTPALPSLMERLNRFSDWTRAKKAIAGCLRFMERLRKPHTPRKVLKKSEIKDAARKKFEAYTVSELERSEKVILQALQQEVFAKELPILQGLKEDKDRTARKQRNMGLKRISPIYKLDPYLDEHNLIRVGGRLKKSAELTLELRHPIILPKKHHVTEMIVRHAHEMAGHQGRGMTVNWLRSSGYWITSCSSVVWKTIRNCTTCIRFRDETRQQKMADLPSDRISTAPPFSYCGIDIFGPFVIREGRKELKRYGCIFSCLASRAIHLEVAASLETDAFINALRRFLAVRGPVRLIRCDQGTNFVGANNELRRELEKMDLAKVNGYLLKQNCEPLEFIFNPPSASHMGGAWERCIRTVRSVLEPMLHSSAGQLDDDALRTLLYEVMNIVNSRPLTTDNLHDSELVPLTPNQILTFKPRAVLAPPGVFVKEDLYLRKRWRRIQHLTNEFWSRWSKEYLQALQPRRKWAREVKNIEVGDVVLVQDHELPRNLWPLALVVDTFPSEDGLVRKVKVKMKNKNELDRPIHKLVLLHRPGIPDEEPNSD